MHGRQSLHFFLFAAGGVLLAAALILLACLLACFLVISYFVYRAKYKRAREKIKSYQGLLKQIDRLYEKESVKVKKESEEFEV